MHVPFLDPVRAAPGFRHRAEVAGQRHSVHDHPAINHERLAPDSMERSASASVTYQSHALTKQSRNVDQPSFASWRRFARQRVLARARGLGCARLTRLDLRPRSMHASGTDASPERCACAHAPTSGSRYLEPMKQWAICLLVLGCAAPPLSTRSALVGETRLRVTTANTTSENGSYDAGHGIRIFRGAHPDVALVQELRYSAGARAFVDAAFGTNFELTLGTGNIPNAVASRFPILEAESGMTPKSPTAGSSGHASTCRVPSTCTR